MQARRSYIGAEWRKAEFRSTCFETNRIFAGDGPMIGDQPDGRSLQCADAWRRDAARSPVGIWDKVRRLDGSNIAACHRVARGTRSHRLRNRLRRLVEPSGCRAPGDFAPNEMDDKLTNGFSQRPFPKKMTRCKHSSFTLRIKRSTWEFRLGERGGSRTACTPACSRIDRNA